LQSGPSFSPFPPSSLLSLEINILRTEDESIVISSFTNPAAASAMMDKIFAANQTTNHLNFNMSFCAAGKDFDLIATSKFANEPKEELYRDVLEAMANVITRN